jgi:uncharacterized membrane protein
LVSMKKIFCFLFLLIAVACKVQTGTDESSRFKVNNFSIDQVNYSLLRDNVLKPQCLQCHSWVNSEAEVNKRITYGDPESSDLYVVVSSGKMPENAAKLNSQSLNLVRLYILKMAGSQQPQKIPLEATYSSLSVNLFEKSCTSCHSAEGRKKKPYLTNKENIIENIDDIIDYAGDAWDRDDDTEMPPKSKGTRISAEVLNMLKEWKNSGFSN